MYIFMKERKRPITGGGLCFDGTQSTCHVHITAHYRGDGSTAKLTWLLIENIHLYTPSYHRPRYYIIVIIIIVTYYCCCDYIEV